MQKRETKIVAPCRLHFGLFSLESDADSDQRSFGGLGAMIDNPSIKVSVSDAEAFRCSGFAADKVREIVDKWLGISAVPLAQSADELKLHIHVDAPQQHTGLGVGTQMTMAIATVLNMHFDMPMPSASELALSMGRGRRSAVGSYGFATGGLIVDGGRESNSPFPDLAGRFDFPEQWRFVLVRPSIGHDFFGQREGAAFADLPAPAQSAKDELTRIAREILVPALIAKNFDEFASSLGHFNRLSGELFAPIQGGPFNGPEITTLVDGLQAAGFAGCGQSSWGPTVFVAVDSETMAQNVQRAAQQIVERDDSIEEIAVTIATANNSGFRVL